jgi:hypothetical protein
VLSGGRESSIPDEQERVMNGSGSACSGQGPANVIDGTTRVVYFNGQRLEDDDLNSAADQMRQLRWMHNRSLHGWGLALGYQATGNAGDRQVTVQPGYAIDCLGRELVLTTPMTLPVPARSGNAQGGPVSFALVASYPDDSQLTVLQTRTPDCGGTAGAVRLQERASIYWCEPPIQTGQQILLAMATVQNCQLSQPLAVDQTRRARPITTPYISAGQSPLGSTPWQLWLETTVSGASTLIGVTAKIDTSAGCFTATPTYQAELRGERYFNTRHGDTEAPFLVDGTLVIGNATPASFIAYILLPQITQDTETGTVRLNPRSLFVSGTNGQDALLALVNSEWTIAWIGVED